MARDNHSNASTSAQKNPPGYSAEDPIPDRSSRKKRTSKEKYALSIQNDSLKAIERVKSSNMIMKSPWAASLASAPTAISTMAILFKVADRKEAKGLEVGSQDVMYIGQTEDIERQAHTQGLSGGMSEYEGTQKDDATPDTSKQSEPGEDNGSDDDGSIDLPTKKELVGSRKAGTLPSKYFHANLQHCSDIGRFAFQDAQHAMAEISAIASDLISESGGIATIIDLLEEPEEARHMLKPEMKSVQKSAKQCLHHAEKITSKFQYWYLVITHLNTCSLTKSGEIAKAQDETSTKNFQARKDKERYEGRKTEIRLSIDTLQQRLRRVETDIDRARFELDQIMSLPPLPEPSALDERERVHHMISEVYVAPKNRGVFTSLKNNVWGMSDKHLREDEDRQAMADARIAEQRNQAIRDARESRERQRQLVTNRLEAARRREGETKHQLNEVWQELSSSKMELEKANTDLAQTEIDLQQLDAKELELEAIMDILDNSMRALSELKDQVEPLVDFFRDICRDINTNVDRDLENFLGSIKLGIQEGSTPEEVESINLGKIGKRKIMFSAMQMQGRFSAIADISDAYTKVSSAYIRPAIRDMERLSKLKGEEWRDGSAEFYHKCEEYMDKINEITNETMEKAQKNITKSIKDVELRAIEAAEEHDSE